VTWLLDTNTLVYILNGEQASEPGPMKPASWTSGDSIVVVAELLYGVERSTRRDANPPPGEGIGAAGDRAAQPRAAAHFGRLKAELRAKGINKADLDMLIAATVLDLGATLVDERRRPARRLDLWSHRRELESLSVGFERGSPTGTSPLQLLLPDGGIGRMNHGAWPAGS